MYLSKFYGIHTQKFREIDLFDFLPIATAITVQVIVSLCKAFGQVSFQNFMILNKMFDQSFKGIVSVGTPRTVKR